MQIVKELLDGDEWIRGPCGGRGYSCEDTKQAEPIFS